MTNSKIPLFRIYWDEEDINAISEVIRSGMNWCVGKQIEEFEEMIKEYLDAKFCVTFNSGGSALYALMQVYNFQSGDEIIVPSFTFIATAYSPLYVGAKPIFSDIESETFGLDPKDVQEKITPKTKAIIPIHYGGMPCKIQELEEIAKDYKLQLIEDAAESFGAKFKGRFVGTFGNSGIFSFCHNKILTTSEGGCVVTNDQEIYEKLKLVRSYGRIIKGDYFLDPISMDYAELGFNFRLSTLLAALGISQLKKVNKTIKMRRKNAEYLNKELKKIREISIPEAPTKDHYPVYQMYTIRILQGEDIKKELMKFLKERGITTRIYFDAVHNYSIFKNLGYENVSLPMTETLCSQVMTLPMFPNIAKDELDYIIGCIEDFFR